MRILKKILLIIWSIFCFIGIIGNFSHYDIIDWLIVIPFVLIPYFLIFKLFRKHDTNKQLQKNSAGRNNATQPNSFVTTLTEAEQMQVANNDSNKALDKPDTYIQANGIIQRADGNAISDEEVPYLMQIGYEKELSNHGLYNGQILDLSFMQERDKNKKEYTTLPTYDELLAITKDESPIELRDISFLEYIHGLPLDNPLIAQKWYYDYNLNYSKSIKKLIANDLLSVNHACVDKLNVSELKNILKSFLLSPTGKKDELLNRIYENLTQEDIDKYFEGAKFFVATKKGKDLIKNKKL